MISISILDEFQKKDIKLDSKQIEFLNLVDASIKEVTIISKSKVQNIQFTEDGRPLPAIVEISESGTCNRTCSFCPRSDPDWKDIKEFISDEMVDKLCNELAEFDYHGLIIISGFVEPLLDKNIYNIIKKFRTALPKSNLPLYQKPLNKGLSAI